MRVDWQPANSQFQMTPSEPSEPGKRVKELVHGAEDLRFVGAEYIMIGVGKTDVGQNSTNPFRSARTCEPTVSVSFSHLEVASARSALDRAVQLRASRKVTSQIPAKPAGSRLI